MPSVHATVNFIPDMLFNGPMKLRIFALQLVAALAHEQCTVQVVATARLAVAVVDTTVRVVLLLSVST